MSEVTIRQASSKEDLQGILDLQWANHKTVVDEATKESQGFVTVRHTMEQLEAMHAIEASTIAMADEKVVAYIIAMTKKSRQLIPVLVPMFDLFDSLIYNGKSIDEYEYMVIGQVCVDKDHRGRSVFRQAYEGYRLAFSDRYDFCITEIDLNNTRSMQAHKNMGFETIHTYKDINGIEWAIVVWDWE
jgi:predicted GNAT superfamily acetyltransferase